MSLKVNGKAYDWGDVDVKFPGLALVVQEISYDDEMEMEESYGYGHRPRGYGTGNYKSSGKISLLRDDYEEFLKWCKSQGIPFTPPLIPPRINGISKIASAHMVLMVIIDAQEGRDKGKRILKKPAAHSLQPSILALSTSSICKEFCKYWVIQNTPNPLGNQISISGSNEPDRRSARISCM